MQSDSRSTAGQLAETDGQRTKKPMHGVPHVFFFEPGGVSAFDEKFSVMNCPNLFTR